mmetsp:Transcript_39407/g.106383  ORF Transcript_39407/g.106383 Transcript_39407/m.106383 type:complete len:269 (-) Transcript_39407:22-828(-)
MRVPFSAPLIQEVAEVFEERARVAQQALNVVVPRAVHPERPRPEPPLARQEEPLAVPERHDLVSRPVDDKDGALDRADPVDVGEHVAGHCEAKVEHDAVGREQRRLQDDPRAGRALLRQLLRQVARRAAAQRAPVENDLVGPQPATDQPAERRLHVVVDVLLVRHDGLVGRRGLLVARLAVARVVVRHHVHVELLGKVDEPAVDHAQVLRVRVREEDRERRLPVDVERRNLGAVGRVDPEERLSPHQRRRLGRLEEEPADGGPHGTGR